MPVDQVPPARALISAATPPSPAASSDLPAQLAHLTGLAARAEAYIAAGVSPATVAAYDDDWRAWLDFCRRQGCPPDYLTPDAIALFLTTLADEISPKTGRRRSLATIRRRLYGLVATAREKGHSVDGRHPLLLQVLKGIGAVHYQPPRRKEALSPDDIRAMVGHLPLDLRGLRNRSLLLLGFVSALRRSELVSLDAERPLDGDAAASRGWIEWHEGGLLIVVRGKGDRWREVPVGHGTTDWTCPVVALRRWLDAARIHEGPVYRPISPAGKVGPGYLDAQQVLYLVQTTALGAGVRADLPEAERMRLFGAHSLRAAVPTYAEVDERRVQRHLGHASVTTTRLYQRERDRFSTNLTLALGL